MEKYSSLTDKLIQNGIIKEKDTNEKTFELFGIELDEDMSNSPFAEKPIEKNKEKSIPNKRLNKYDLELINIEDDCPHRNTFEIIKRFLNKKENLASQKALGLFENFLFAFFPKLYKAKLTKDAMTKLKALNIDTQKLLDKTIPYGEKETRYQNLIKYINFANKIQTKLNEKIN